MKDDEMMFLNVRIRKDLHKRLKINAVEIDKSCQEIISELIEEYLTKQEKSKD